MTDAEFERFHAETAAPLHAYLSRAGGDASLADDLVQAAYLRFLRARKLPRAARARRVYLFRIATNLLRDEYRRRAGELRRSRRLAAAAAAGSGDPHWGVEWEVDASGPAFESRLDVRRAFEALSLRDRELLWLACVTGMNHREIAGTAGIAESSVRVLLYRARRRFALILHERGIGPEDLA